MILCLAIYRAWSSMELEQSIAYMALGNIRYVHFYLYPALLDVLSIPWFRMALCMQNLRYEEPLVNAWVDRGRSLVFTARDLEAVGIDAIWRVLHSCIDSGFGLAVVRSSHK